MASESRFEQAATTIPVRNVQALAACGADELTAKALERYIRPDIDRDAVFTEHSGEVPVVDLGRLLNSESVEEETAKLRFACEEWGFFELVNHGVPEEIIANIKRDMHEFFQLPLEAKNVYAQRPGDLQGYGQMFVVSNDQKLDWADMFAILTQPTQVRDTRYWPTQPYTFRKSIEEYSSELEKVAHSVVFFIAKTLNVDHELMGDKYVVQTLRMNYYPPCMSTSEKVLGLSPHSDACFLTFLLEVNSVEGLQIRRHGVWIPVNPRPEALLVNVGDMLEIMTNGKYKSIEHRVTINAHKERLSISAFHNAKFDGVISPVMGINTGDKVLYKTVTVEEYFKHYMSNKLDGKSALDHAKVVLNGGSDINEKIIALAAKPNRCVVRYSGYVINGFRFHTMSRGAGHTTQNSGVVNIADDGVNYYGRLSDIVELSYTNYKVVLFKCDWYDVYHRSGMKIDEFGFTLVNFSRKIHSGEKLDDDPFVFSSQVEQVFYVEDPKAAGWHVVTRFKPRDLFDMGVQQPAADTE